MEKSVLNDIIDWDVVNWSKAISFWEKNAAIKDKSYNCLELGANKGGLSLWLAQNRNTVLCTDLNGPEKSARFIHEKYKCSERVEYAALDATKIPFKNHFDVVVFKSILGGISGDRNEYKNLTVKEMYEALKPGGMLLFAENLEATSLHKVLRKKYGTKNWNYLKMTEISDVFRPFSKIKYTTVGFLGCMGRTASQRNLLGKVDTVLEKIIPKKYRYILIGVAIK